MHHRSIVISSWLAALLPPRALPSPQEQEEEPEDEALKKQDEHYLRELRICLREVGGDIG